jgi:putative membrane protein
MVQNIIEFLAYWGITALSLWVASFIFRGIAFSDRQSLFVSALLLGLANTIIKPVIVLLTIPLTILTFGLFLLVINALMMLMVAWAVPGFRISGFWTAFFASIFIAMLSFLLGLFIFQSHDYPVIYPTHHGVLI